MLFQRNYDYFMLLKKSLEAEVICKEVKFVPYSVNMNKKRHLICMQYRSLSNFRELLVSGAKGK